MVDSSGYMMTWWSMVKYISFLPSFLYLLPTVSSAPLSYAHVFLGRGSSTGFHLTFPPTRVLTPQLWEPIWGCCQLLAVSSPMMYSETGEDLGLTSPTVSCTSSNTALFTHFHNLYSACKATAAISGLLKSMPVQSSYRNHS